MLIVAVAAVRGVAEQRIRSRRNKILSLNWLLAVIFPSPLIIIYHILFYTRKNDFQRKRAVLCLGFFTKLYILFTNPAMGK